MKRFLKNLLIFCLVLSAVLILEDILVTYAYHHKITRKYRVWNEIIHTSIDADLLILGNSRAWCQYSPQILDSILGTNSYNIGIDGSAINRQRARYDIYRHYQEVKPKYLIHNVEFFTLGGLTIGYEREQFMPYMMFPYARKRIIDAGEPFSFGELYIPMYRYYTNNVYDDYTKFDYVIEKGYFGEDIPWDGSKLADLEPYVAPIDSQALNIFIDFIEELIKDDIQIVLVSAPIYRGATQKVLNYDEYTKLYTNLSAQFGLSFLDYSDYYLCEDTIYFYNATHMNKQGAELFSVQLARDLDSLGIIKE